MNEGNSKHDFFERLTRGAMNFFDSCDKIILRRF